MIKQSDSTRLPIHVIIYGDSGGGKTTCAASFPGPLIVFNFDAYGKEKPYRALGDRMETSTSPEGVIVQSIYSGDTLKCSIENYTEEDPYNPVAYKKFLTRLVRFTPDERTLYGTLVLDSITSMELAARKEQQYRLNKNAKDPRQWYAASTERLEEVLCMRFGAIRDLNVVVLAHIDEAKDEFHGMFVRNPACPGRLRKQLSAFYNEMYRAHTIKDDKGVQQYVLQTRSDAMYTAFSMECNAPDPSWNRYEDLWPRIGEVPKENAA